MKYVFYPVVLFGSLAAALALSRSGMKESTAVGLVVVLAGLVILIAEQSSPRSASWVPTRREWWRDLASSALWHSVLPAGIHAAFAVAVTALGAKVGALLGCASIWPTQAPLAVQVWLALVLAEFGPYFSHRLFHGTERGWSLHSVHHSTQRMHFLAAGRNHPLNVFVTTLLKMCTLALMQVPAEVLMLATCFNGVNGLLQHANVEQRTPLIDWVLSTPELHVWHHSKEPLHANSNYGTNVIFWDVLFGTRHKPAGEVSTDVGLAYPFPETLLGQLGVPFRWKKVAALMHARHGARR